MAIESFSQQSCRGRFPHSTRAGKEVRMMQSPVLDSVAKRACDWFLASDFVESLRSPLAGDYLIGHELSLIAFIFFFGTLAEERCASKAEVSR